jgi:malate synthase
MMEDAATAEIARSQVWQWIRHGAEIDGRRVTPELVRRIEDEELEGIREQVGDEFFETQGRPRESREIFEDVALGDRFEDFLTIPAYARLED